MIRHLIVASAAAALLAISALPAAAQYRGGPIYGGPFRGGGPSLFTGPFAPPYYAYPLTGAGFGPSFIGAIPYGGGGGIIVAPGSNGLVYPSTFPTTNAVIYPPGQNQHAMAQPPIKPSNPGDGSRLSPDNGTPNTPPSTGTGRAYFTVKVVPDAKVLVNDVETKETGAARRFHTPATLVAGKEYEYTFRAQWIVNSQPVTRDRTVRFKPGDDLTVDFTEATAR